MECVSDKEFDLLLRNRFKSRSSSNNYMVDYEYNYNQTFLKKFSDGVNIKYRVVFMGAVKNSGIELEPVAASDEFLEDGGTYLYDEKLQASLSRSKRRIYELAFCNPFEYFFTGTFNSDLVGDRSDLNSIHKSFTQWIRNQKKKYNCDIQFLIVPEKHSDNVSWHFHGFILGLPLDCLCKYVRSDYWSFDNQHLPRLPTKIIKELENGFDVFHWVDFDKKYGFNTLEPIKDHDAVSKYCTKYITKDVLKSVTDVGAHCYYRSRGLRDPEILKVGVLDDVVFDSLPWEVENEFCRACWIDEEQAEKIKHFIL